MDPVHFLLSINPLALVQSHTVSTAPPPHAETAIPTEVIKAIIDQASNVNDYESLRNLSLLSKDLLTRARFHLFTGIVIRNVEQMNSSPEFLDSHPWVRPLVRKVTLLSSTEGCTTPNIPLLDICRVHLFIRLPNLRVWRMDVSSLYAGHRDAPQPRCALHRSALLCYRTYGENIQVLELENLRFEDVSHFAQLLSALTGLRTLTCWSLEIVKKRRRTLVHGAENINRPVKFPRLQQLYVVGAIDIPLFEYLLHANAATLSTLVFPLSTMGVKEDDGGSRFAEMDDLELSAKLIGQLSKLSSLKLVIGIGMTTTWDPWEGDRSDGPVTVDKLRSTTKILERIASGTSSAPAVSLQFFLYQIAALGAPLACGSSSLQACTALETAVLEIKGMKTVEFIDAGNRAGRAELWSEHIMSAFPGLKEKGILTWPRSRPSDPPGHEYAVTCLAPSPDSKWIATGSADGTIIIWDAKDGTVAYEQKLAYWGSVGALAFSPGSQRLVSAGGKSGDSTLIVWALDNGRVSKVATMASVDLKKPDDDAAVTCAWSPDGTLIASACRDGPVHVWDTFTFQQRGLSSPHTAEFHPLNNRLLQWSPDSHYLMWIYSRKSQDGPNCDDEVAIWSPLGEEPPLRLPSHPTFPADFCITAFSLDPTRRRISIGLRANIEEQSDSEEEEPHRPLGCVLVWDIANNEALAILEHTSEVWDVAFSPHSRSLLSLSKDGLMKTWDTDSWREEASLKGSSGQRESQRACFSPGGKYVASVTYNAKPKAIVQLWRTEEPLCMTEFTISPDSPGPRPAQVPHPVQIDYMPVFSPNGEFLAYGEQRGRVYIHCLSDFI